MRSSSLNRLPFIQKSIDPALKIVLAVKSLACLTQSSNAPEAALASIDAVNGKVRIFNAQFGRKLRRFSA